MNAYDITDNSLDFDSKEPKKEAKKTEKNNDDLRPDGSPKQWLNKYKKGTTVELPAYWKIVNGAKDEGLTVKDLRKFYMFTKEVAKELETDLNK